MIGLVVNPVAGVGGPAGLAGSDGADVQRLAFARGAHSRVQERATLALKALAARHPGLVVATAAGPMGADAVRAAGLVPRVLHSPLAPAPSPAPPAPPALAPSPSTSASARLVAECTASSREHPVHSAASRALGDEVGGVGGAGTDAGDTARAAGAHAAAAAPAPAALAPAAPAALAPAAPAAPTPSTSASARLVAECTASSRQHPVHSAASRALGNEVGGAGGMGGVGTDAGDTARAVGVLAAAGVDLILVVGGDGTLRDAVAGLAAVKSRQTPHDTMADAGALDVPHDAMADAGALDVAHDTMADAGAPDVVRDTMADAADAAPRSGVPAVLGVPAGVKMYSPVFAVSPRAAGVIAADWIDRGGLPTDDREVLDIDEAAMRLARVDPTLYGMLRVPYRAGRTQSRKAATPVSESAAVEAAARGAVARMRPGIRYLLGPGGTTAEIARQLGVEGSPLGVDVVLDGTLTVRGASEQQLLTELALGPAQAVITVIGGQGFLLGRGNQQLSASVLRALGDDPLLVVAPEQKLVDLRGRPLLVDTGDPELDARLAGHVRIITGVGTSSLYAVTAPELDHP